MLACATACGATPPEVAQVTLGKPTEQVIDGFGATAGDVVVDESWLPELMFGDLGASILRMDLTPRFKAPYSDSLYNSPWFHNAPALPGPEGNNVRTYHDVGDYSRVWADRSARIAVMGPDIERNLAYFEHDDAQVHGQRAMVKRGQRDRDEQGGFKLVGSLWSPAPWLKRPSGNKYSGPGDVMPKEGTPFPFIWGGNFTGGALDTSDTKLAAFDDSALGGTGPTSALTQFGRSVAAYLLGLQRALHEPFYALSIQNELNFETFYNSCTYLQAADYVAALKAVRRELDKHAELRAIRLMGPEDLLGVDAYSLWEYNDGKQAIQPKNLQYMAAVDKDPEAKRALDFFAVHGYAPDGVQSAGADPASWRLWTSGWERSPAPNIPDSVRGFRSYGKKSWMTETSGEVSVWAPQQPSDLSNSAVGMALKIHQALTAGQQSAWVYWMLVRTKVDGNSLTDLELRERAPKYAAAKHYFRFIRPGARRLDVVTTTGSALRVSAYVHAKLRTTTVVVVNPTDKAQSFELKQPAGGAGAQLWESSASALWQARKPAAKGGRFVSSVPAYGVQTWVMQ